MFRTNVGSQAVFAQMNSREDGSPLTADVTVKVVTGAAGTYEDSAGTLTHLGGGLWRYVPTDDELNAPDVAVQFNHATGVNVGLTLLTTAANPADAAALGLTNLDAAVSTRAPESGGNVAAIKASTDNLPSDPADQSLIIAATDAIIADTEDIQGRLPAALTGAGNIKADAQVVSDKTSYALSSAGVQAIWDALTSALTTAGSIGKRIVDFLIGGVPAGSVGLRALTTTFALKKGDTLPALSVTLLNPDRTTHDLTGATRVDLHIELEDETKIAREMAIDADPTTGIVTYAWVAADWDTLVVSTKQHHKMEYQVTRPGSATQTFPNRGYHRLEISEDLD
jgi:hypothetical protein